MSWGTCGFTAFVGTGVPGRKLQPAATVFFAPTRFLPGVEGLPSTVSSDALLLSDVYVEDAFMGLYLEHRLIETVLVEAGRRGFSAVEVFARDEDALDELLRKQENEARGITQDAGLEYSGTPSFPSPSSASCVIPRASFSCFRSSRTKHVESRRMRAWSTAGRRPSPPRRAQQAP